jgi:hypothetical protein
MLSTRMSEGGESLDPVRMLTSHRGESCGPRAGSSERSRVAEFAAA